MLLSPVIISASDVAFTCSIPTKVVVYPVTFEVPELPFVLSPSVSRTIVAPETTISLKYAQSSSAPPSSKSAPNPPFKVSFPAPPTNWFASAFPEIMSAKLVPITFSILSRYFVLPKPSFITLYVFELPKVWFLFKSTFIPAVLEVSVNEIVSTPASPKIVSWPCPSTK